MCPVSRNKNANNNPALLVRFDCMHSSPWSIYARVYVCKTLKWMTLNTSSDRIPFARYASATISIAELHFPSSASVNKFMRTQMKCLSVLLPKHFNCFCVCNIKLNTTLTHRVSRQNGHLFSEYFLSARFEKHD